MKRFNPLLGALIVRTGGTTGLVGSFGMTRNGGKKMHKGIDYLADLGTPIIAAHDGVIGRAGFERNGSAKEVNDGYGLRVTLTGGDGIETRYGHMASQVFKKDMPVRCGQMIGTLGNSGNALHPVHLHFEVRINGEPVNPDWWLTGEGSREGIQKHDLAT